MKTILTWAALAAANLLAWAAILTVVVWVVGAGQ